jgi:hypothetical protein
LGNIAFKAKKSSFLSFSQKCVLAIFIKKVKEELLDLFTKRPNLLFGTAF